MGKHFLFGLLCTVAALFIFLQLDCSSKKMSKDELVAKGKYLVNLGGCNDCHSPKVMTQMGPVPDTTRLLSGHPENEPSGDIDMQLVAPGKWFLAGQDLTEWVGPWGVSFSANITPDSTTGIGAWTFENFVNTMRNGKHLGTGRDILPPMPWQAFGQLSDEDLRAIFTYLQSLPPISNRVPNPIPPNVAEQKLNKN